MILIALLLVSVFCHAQLPTLFDGGMMLHAGVVNGQMSDLNYTAKGVTTGIGGTLRFHLCRHLRVGCEGFMSTLSQLGNDSYVRLGWGGVVVDAYWQLDRWTPYVGLTLGGGNATTLLVFDGSSDDWLPEPNAVLHSEGFMFVDPYLGIEYALTEAVHLTLRVDRLAPFSHSDIPTGPRLYLGFIFTH
ncbi:MAG: hypothetical protein IJ785_07990 [Bacteroidales bacterium]|nr:hypothetical protein [Bacteroidales bacterium]